MPEPENDIHPLTRSIPFLLPGLLLLGLIILGGTIAFVLSNRLPTPRPNVVLITLDTTRADRLGCYGYPKPTTPVLDALAGESAVFEMAISTASVTNVSHATILTGLNPPRHGCRVLHGNTDNQLADEQTTLAELLSEHGYTTAAFVSAFPVTRYFGLDQGFDVFDQDFSQAEGQGLVTESGTVNTGTSQRHAGRTTDAVLRWLDTAPEPYFLWVHYFDPHDVRVLPPNEEFKELFKRFRSTRTDSKQKARLDSAYDAELCYMDEQIGRLLDEIKRKRQWDNTVTLVTADHGEGLGDHDWWTHGILYQEQIRVPLLLHGRRKGTQHTVKPGRIRDLVRTIDIAPTLLDLIGIESADWPDIDGRSLLALLAGDISQAPRFAYADSINMLTYGTSNEIQDVKDDRLFSVMDGEWKLIIHQLHPENSELYNLIDDPGELNNRFTEAGEIKDRLLGVFQEIGADLTYIPDPTDTPPAVLKGLQGIGYVDK